MKSVRKNICEAILAFGLAVGSAIAQSSEESYNKWKEQVTQTEEIRKNKLLRQKKLENPSPRYLHLSNANYFMLSPEQTRQQ